MKKILNEVKSLLKKIKNYDLNSDELDKFIEFLIKKIEAKDEGFKKISNDDVEWLRIISFLLNKLELRDKGEDYSIEAGEWRELEADFAKLKHLIDEIETQRIIDRATWFLGGGCFYNILDGARYKDFLYDKIHGIIQKIGKEEEKKEQRIEKIVEQIFMPQYPTEPQKKEEAIFRTNFKHIEAQLKSVVEKWSSILYQDEIENWIRQFDTTEEQLVALRVLDNLRFYDQKEIRKMCQICHTKLLFDLDRNEIDKIIFTPVGPSGKSGQMFGYLYRIENNIPENLFIYYSDLDNVKDKDTIVFIDDVLATGDQFIGFVREELHMETLLEKEIENIYYLPIIGFEEGIENVKSNLNNKIKVISCDTLDKRDRLFYEENTVFSSNEKETAEKILQKYGEKLYKNNGLGYKNFGALITFYYRTPNITIPVIWSNIKGWNPLFKRYHK